MIENILTTLSYISYQTLGFSSIDINTATFSDTDIIPAYKDPGTRQWGAKVANNTAYNFRRSDQNLFIENDTYTVSASSSSRTYDTDRDYIGKYIKVELGLSGTIMTLPFGIISNVDALTTEWMQLTTTYQTLPKNGLIQIRALNGGGFQIKVTASSVVTRYLLGSITESRKISGS